VNAVIHPACLLHIGFPERADQEITAFKNHLHDADSIFCDETDDFGDLLSLSQVLARGRKKD